MYIKKKKRISAKVGLVPTGIWEGNLNTQAINIEWEHIILENIAYFYLIQ